MERLHDRDPPRAETVDPCRYVRQADLALLSGRREEAVALIGEAYLAFDLLRPNCEDVTAWGRVWPERSS